jgi:hypothetical protein
VRQEPSNVSYERSRAPKRGVHGSPCYRWFSACRHRLWRSRKEWILPKSDAERLLKQAIACNKNGDAGQQAAAELLAIVLQTVFEFQPPTRQ